MEVKHEDKASGEVQFDSVEKESINEESKQENKVAYESYQKVLREKKGIQEKLRSYESKEAERAEQLQKQKEESYAKQGEYKKLLELRDAELAEVKSRVEAVEKERTELGSRIIDDLKERALLDSLPGKLKRPEYMNFLNKDAVAMDPETGEIDKNSVVKAANDFAENYSDLIDTKSFRHLPNGTPNGNGGALTLEQWQSLPLKEMSKRMKDVKIS